MTVGLANLQSGHPVRPRTLASTIDPPHENPEPFTINPKLKTRPSSTQLFELQGGVGAVES